MAAFIEPLPGLLDDPLLHLPDLPSRTDVRIPPLRDPFPSRYLSLPSPLEPNTPGDRQTQPAVQLGSSKDAPKPMRITTPPITPTDGPSAGDMKKPDIAISALVGVGTANSAVLKSLPPSFVNLAAVENNPSSLSQPPDNPTSKRMKLDHGEYLQLPMPKQKETTPRVPMLPVMVNGIHEPPPSAALLPPIELEAVKAILASMSDSSPPPQKVLNIPEADREDVVQLSPTLASASVHHAGGDSKANFKPARAWRRWSDEETAQLLRGVARHGPGKWKEICADPELSFRDRKPMDLKDRFRTCVPGAGKKKAIGLDQCSSNGSAGSSIAELLRPIESSCSSAAVATPQKIRDSQGFKEGDTGSIISKTASIDLAAALTARGRQRVRKPWTEDEHTELIRGFAKHGYHWTAIHKDDEINLSHRKATDIRDKFRSLFPQQYMDAERGMFVSRTSPGSKGSAAAAKTEKAASPPTAAQCHTSRQQQQQQHPIPESSSVVKATRPKPSRAASSENSNSTNSTNSTNHDASQNTTSSAIDNTNYHYSQQEPISLSLSAAASSSAIQSNLTTLPSLSLGGNTDWDWDDNKLAPLVDWEEFGI